MLYIRNVLTLNREMVDYSVESPFEEDISATGLSLFPALIDPHVSATPKEAWKILARCALSAGVTQAVIHSNADCTHHELKKHADEMIKQSRSVKIPINFLLFASPLVSQLNALPLTKPLIRGAHLKTSDSFFSSHEYPSLERLFRLCSEHNLPLMIHFDKAQDTGKARLVIELSERFQVKTYLYPIYKSPLVDLAEEAKQNHLPAYFGTHLAPLVLDSISSKDWSPLLKSLAKDVPSHEREFLWNALRYGYIDCIGSDHQIDHASKEFRLTSACSMELLYPILLTIGLKQGLSLEQIIALTSKNAEQIFNLAPSRDVVLVDFHETKMPSQHFFRARGDYTPYHSLNLTGWPVYTLCQGRAFKLFQKPTSNPKG